MSELWNKNVEKQFFENAFNFASPEQLFYITDDNEYLAYLPKKYKGKKSTLQRRNSLIGNYTEKWSQKLVQSCLDDTNLFVIQGAICEEIGLSNKSPADIVITEKEGVIQRAEDIKAIFEVKMSIVWNWEFRNNNLTCIGDYTSHKGNPGLLRSDSMLKAIGKSVNIRVSSNKSASIPIIIIGNTPITESYISKVDSIYGSGIIQKFCSINPKPLDSDKPYIKQSIKKGFESFEKHLLFQNFIMNTIDTKHEYFSSMKNKEDLGKIIEIANREKTYIEKAEKFLRILKE